MVHALGQAGGELKTARRVKLTLLLAPVLVAGGIAGFVLTGQYNVAADAPHTRPVLHLLTLVRERSVARQARDIVPPLLEAPELIRSGAGNYDAMCADCHLAPGRKSSELYRGLYPSPPRLDSPERSRSAATDFWIIKHGIKASGMPAWGHSMEDRYIWGLVAFLEQLPTLDEAQYRELVAASPGHAHGGGETQKAPDVSSGAPAPDHHHGSHSKPHAH